MASVSSEGGDNKLNVELNLVPFIDLLSSLVLFLLVTAVWEQVGTIPASVESEGKARFSTAEQTHLLIHLTNKGFKLTWPERNRGGLPSFVDSVNGKLNFQRLEMALNIFPKQTTMPLVAVSSDDNVEYGLIITTIDSAKKAGFTSVALSTN